MMTKINLFLVGIGTGNPDHVTRQAEQMLRAADIIMIPHKGKSKVIWLICAIRFVISF